MVSGRGSEIYLAAGSAAVCLYSCLCRALVTSVYRFCSCRLCHVVVASVVDSCLVCLCRLFEVSEASDFVVECLLAETPVRATLTVPFCGFTSNNELLL